MDKEFDGKKATKLGTPKRPAVVSVQTEARLQEVKALFEEHGWEHDATLDSDKPEDVADLELLMTPRQPIVVEKKAGRNDPCPCGSGKKYKKCCGKAA